MAIFRFAAAVIKRSAGRSATAAAAYRAGIEIADARTGRSFDYTRKTGILHTEILAPADAPAWMRDRAELWNAVEDAEKRKDAQLAREVQLALPHELTRDQHVALVREFAATEFVARGMVADIAIHAPDREGDHRNAHAHIMLTMREIDADGFGQKARDWNASAQLEHWREAWAAHGNRALERAGHEARIDHRTLEDQRIDREPTVHIGPTAMEMERRGVSTDRGDQNRDIEAANAQRQRIGAELAGVGREIDEIELPARLERAQRAIDNAEAVWRRAETPKERDAEGRADQQGREPEAIPGPPPASGGGESRPEHSPPNSGTIPPRSGEHADMPDQPDQSDPEAERQKQAARTETDRQATEAAAQQERLDKAGREHAEHVEQRAKENADRLRQQSHEMEQTKARIDEYMAECRQEAERQKQPDDRGSGPTEIRDAHTRYAQAIGRHYDIRDPYATLARAAGAEYAAFMTDREKLSQEIARASDPAERAALELRQRIEGLDYLALTGERIARQSEIITGRMKGEEATNQRKRVTACQAEATKLRQQYREHQAARDPHRAPEPDRAKTQAREQERGAPQPPAPEPQPQRPVRHRAPGHYDALTPDAQRPAPERKDAPQPQKSYQDQLIDELRARAEERQRQEQRDRDLQRQRDRNRDRDR